MHTADTQETLSLKDFTFIKELELGSNGRARCYKDNKSTKDIYVFKQVCHISPTDFSMQCLKYDINFESLLSYDSITKQAIKENPLYLVSTKYFETGSLKDRVLLKSLNSTEKTIIIFGIASAIYFLHSNDLFHGHLYPSNVILNSEKEPKVCDFSLYQLHPYDTSKLIEIKKSPFLSPEQISESKVDAKTDVFSFGKVLYYLLFEENNDIKNNFYEQLIAKCCDQNPNKRPLFSEIIELFTASEDFILDGADVQEVADYQQRLFPFGFNGKTFLVPNSISNRSLFLLSPIQNDEIKENFTKEVTRNSMSKSPIRSNSISIFSVESNFFPKDYKNNFYNDRLSFDSKKINLKVPSFSQGPGNEDRKKKSKSHFFTSPKLENYEELHTVKSSGQHHFYYSDIYKGEYEGQFDHDDVIDANLKISADCGNIESQFRYGNILLNGPVDSAQEGTRYIKFAADGGHLQAQKLYAYLARNGVFIPKSMKLCDHYMKLAADSGDLNSQIEYASLLDQTATEMMSATNSASSSSSGLNSTVAQTLKNAAKYYYLAAQQNDCKAQFMYGTFLEEGKGVQVDVNEAIRYFRLSAEQGYTIAQLKLAYLLKSEESVKFLKMAADSGNTFAMVVYAKLLIHICMNSKTKLYSKLRLGTRFSARKFLAEAMNYLGEAIDLDSQIAMYVVGCIMYYFSDALRTKKLLFMGNEIEKSENDIFVDDDDEDDEDSDSINEEEEDEISMEEEEECLEDKNKENASEDDEDGQNEPIDLNNPDQQKIYHKTIKSILAIICKSYIDPEEFERENLANTGRIQRLFSHFKMKKENKNEKKIKILKESGLGLIQKASSLGYPRAQFQLVLIDLPISHDVGVMDIKFLDNLINPNDTASSASSSMTSNNHKKKVTFNSNNFSIVNSKSAYFDDYWDEKRPIIISNDDKTSQILDTIIKASTSGLSDSQYFIGILLNDNEENQLLTQKIERAKSSIFASNNLNTDGLIVTDTSGEFIKLAADSGSVRAQLSYALILDDGHGIPKNLRDASKYYKLAADGGNYPAMINIGFMLFDGRGINRNRKEALKYMKAAADANYLVACFKCGMMLYNGQGVEKDVKLSIKYFEKVIKNEAQLTSPGIRYASETSSLQMMQESARNIRSAAEQGVSEAMRVYAIMLLKDICFPLNVSESFRWFKKAAKMNDPIALNFVANRIFKTGEGDKTSAIKMLKTAADNGYNIAQFNYAMIIEEGDESIDLQQDLQKAALYYKKAADQNYAPAQLHYAMMLECGDGVRKNIKMAAFYYKKAARSQSEAMIQYGKMLRKGIYVKKNVKLALKYFKTAAKMGNKEGQYLFARMLQKGEGVDQDKNLAATLFKEAASQPMISRSLCTSKAQFRYAESLLEKNKYNFLHFNEAIQYYLAASDYEEAPEMYKYRVFDKNVRKIRFTLVFLMLIFYLINKLFL